MIEWLALVTDLDNLRNIGQIAAFCYAVASVFAGVAWLLFVGSR